MQNTITIPIEEYMDLIRYKILFLRTNCSGPITDQQIVQLEEKIAKLKSHKEKTPYQQGKDALVGTYNPYPANSEEFK